jgi:hypothetical protein
MANVDEAADLTGPVGRRVWTWKPVAHASRQSKARMMHDNAATAQGTVDYHVEIFQSMNLVR